MRPRRPAIITLLACYLLANPFLQVAAVLAPQHARLFNFGPHWLSYAVYILVAPLVGYLLWTGHPRARFAVYLFLSLELFRGLRFRHWDAVAFALVVIALLQTPGARRFCPSIRSAELRARLRKRLPLARVWRKPGGPPSMRARRQAGGPRP